MRRDERMWVGGRDGTERRSRGGEVAEGLFLFSFRRSQCEEDWRGQEVMASGAMVNGLWSNVPNRSIIYLLYT